MCGICKAKAAAMNMNKPPLVVNNTDCKPLEYYQALLDNLVPVTKEQLLLKSLLTSQINIYYKDCAMFKKNIEDLK